MGMTEGEAWAIVREVWQKIIQKGAPFSFGRLLYGSIREGYSFDKRFYEALQISLLSDRYGKPTTKHHYVSVRGSRSRDGISLQRRKGKEAKSCSFFRIWGSGRGPRVKSSKSKT